MFDAIILHEGLVVIMCLIIIFLLGIFVGIDAESGKSSTVGSGIILIPALILSGIGIFYNYSARDITIQYLLKDKTEKQIKEINATKNVKKIIIYNYLKMKEKEMK